MENKKSFILYCDMINTVKKLPRETIGDLFLLILDFVNDIEHDPDNLLLEIAFEPIKTQLIRDKEKWDKIKLSRSEAGKKGMETRWKTEDITNDNNVIDDITNITVNENVSDSVNENETVINNSHKNVNLIPLQDNSNKKEKKEKKGGALIPFTSADIFDKKIFSKAFKELGWPKAKCKFYYESADSYSAQGNKYINWEKAIRNWALRDDTQKKYTWPSDEVANNGLNGLQL